MNFLAPFAEMLDGGHTKRDRYMKREALIRELRKLAGKSSKNFEILPGQGKGSHYQVRFGDRKTTIKSGELRPGYVALIKKQLGID